MSEKKRWEREKERRAKRKNRSKSKRRQTGLTRWPSGISPAKSVPRSGDSGSTHRRYSREREGEAGPTDKRGVENGEVGQLVAVARRGQRSRERNVEGA